MTDHVLVLVVDLFRIRISSGPERDQAHTETFALQAAFVTDLFADLLEFPQGLPDLHGFQFCALSLSQFLPVFLFYNLQSLF